jgi:hypothetical protein
MFNFFGVLEGSLLLGASFFLVSTLVNLLYLYLSALGSRIVSAPFVLFYLFARSSLHLTFLDCSSFNLYAFLSGIFSLCETPSQGKMTMIVHQVEVDSSFFSR